MCCCCPPQNCAFPFLSSLSLPHAFSTLLLSLCIFFLLSPPLPFLSLLFSRMSHYTDEPRFTIEQIDLLQRLRRTGMTKQEILHGMDTLDRLDREHGDKFGHRTSYGGGASGSVSDPNCTSNNTAATTSSTTSSSCIIINSNATSGSSNVNNTTPASSCTNSTVAQTQYLSPRGGLSPSNSYDTSPPPSLPSAVRHSPVSLVTMAQNGGRDSLVATPNGKLSPPRYPVNSAAAARAFGFEATEEELEIDDKVEELMRSVMMGLGVRAGSKSHTSLQRSSLKSRICFVVTCHALYSVSCQT